MTAPFRSPLPALRPFAALVLAALLAVLAACGGGTSQYDPFVPQRLFAFGDEASALADGTGSAPRGANYAINGLDANGAFDCRLRGNWVQTTAGAFGFVFPECAGTVTSPQARTWAKPQARVRDIDAQIQRQIEAGGFGDKDFATYFVGTNDIVELYTQYPTRSEADLIAEARQRGVAAGLQVNRLAALGAKVLVSNLPDLSLAPYARQQDTLTGDPGRSALIGRLTAAFNEQLGVTILADGRFVGWVDMYQRTQAISRAPSFYALDNIAEAVCAAASQPPACTTTTLVTNGSADRWLWAGDRWFGNAGHFQMAELAIARAQRNPF